MPDDGSTPAATITPYRDGPPPERNDFALVTPEYRDVSGPPGDRERCPPATSPAILHFGPRKIVLNRALGGPELQDREGREGGPPGCR